MNPLVDINIASYNHANYLKHTLEGVLSQQTSFHYRILIGDDCSTDGSIEIIKEYERKFPDRISTIYQKINLGLNHPEKNGIILLKKSTSKYIALLDGDDYWTDPLKLQKQVDFLENNPDFAICFHAVTLLNEETQQTENKYYNKDVSTIEDLCQGNYIHTASCIFRNGLIEKLPKWFSSSPVGDWPLYLMAAEHGKIKYIDEPMAVYRMHNKGIWSKQDRLGMFLKWRKVIILLNNHFKGKYKKYFYAGLTKTYLELVKLYRNENIFYSIFYSIKLLVILKYNKFLVSRRGLIKILINGK
jgi:glycosyltransferase involved in cell wall biosynthesis